MLRHIRAHLSYANVMATIAVFIALGGGAYAIKIKRNSVKSKHVAPEAIKGVDADEATFDSVPNAANAANAANATNAGNAGTIDGLDSTAFANAAALGTVQGQVGAIQSQLPAGVALLSGSANPNATSRDLFFSLPAMELEVETDGDIDDDNNIIVEDVGPAATPLGVQTPVGAALITGSQQFDAGGAFGGPASQVDALVSEAGERLFIHCLFPDGQLDTCYGIYAAS